MEPFQWTPSQYRSPKCVSRSTSNFDLQAVALERQKTEIRVAALRKREEQLREEIEAVCKLVYRRDKSIACSPYERPMLS